MMKKVVVLTAVLISCFAVSAIAAAGPYVSGNLGITMPTDSDVSGGNGELTYDAGFAIGAALGYSFGDARLEAEAGYKIADMDKGLGLTGIDGDLRVHSLMGNGYIDLKISPTVKPYLMAGIGMANIALDSNDLHVDDDDTVFAYQAGAGFGYALNNKVTLDFSYRYMGTTDAEIDGEDVEYGSHNFLAGIRVQF